MKCAVNSNGLVYIRFLISSSISAVFISFSSIPRALHDFNLLRDEAVEFIDFFVDFFVGFSPTSTNSNPFYKIS